MTEKKTQSKQLLARLDEVPLGNLDKASFGALMRLQLYFTQRTHELLLAFGDKARGAILRKGGRDAVLGGAETFALQSDLMRIWGDIWSEWQAEFQQTRREAARIAFGVQAVRHMRLVAPLSPSTATSPQLGESTRIGGRELNESSITDGIYDPQLRILMDLAAEYLYGDGVTLSGRIWKIDREAREGINTVLLNGIQKGASAWDIAKELEPFLGAGQDCPRWTSTRLYNRTKSDIANDDPGGLLRGSDCTGSGVAYKALRLARTEIQKIHSLATDRMMAQQPWVESEKVNTSPSHGETDECDDVASGGDKGDGVYPVGTINLPLHPECLCYKTAVLMDEADFVNRINGWMNGSETWSEMDAYANDLGVPLDSDLTPASINLAVWLFGEDLEKWMQ